MEKTHMNILVYKSLTICLYLALSLFTPQQALAQSSAKHNDFGFGAGSIENSFGATNHRKNIYSSRKKNKNSSLVNAINHYNLAVEHIKLNRLDKAEKSLLKAFKSPDLHREVYYQLAVISDRRGNDEKKQQYLSAFYSTLDAQNNIWREQSG